MLLPTQQEAQGYKCHWECFWRAGMDRAVQQTPQYPVLTPDFTRSCTLARPRLAPTAHWASLSKLRSWAPAWLYRNCHPLACCLFCEPGAGWCSLALKKCVGYILRDTSTVGFSVHPLNYLFSSSEVGLRHEPWQFPVFLVCLVGQR